MKYTYRVVPCGKICTEHYRNDGGVVIAEYPDGCCILHIIGRRTVQRFKSLEEAKSYSERL